MATKANPGKFDCYANAEHDEPMFVLLARDRHAPALVWLWSVLREIEGEDVVKVNEARDCMVAMVEWSASRDRKTCGIGVAALAAVMELIRSANAAVKVLREGEPKNAMTTIEEFRLFLAGAEMKASPRFRQKATCDTSAGSPPCEVPATRSCRKQPRSSSARSSK